MNESDFQTKFNRWLKHCWAEHSAVFELKFSKTNSLPFSAVKPHQIENLTIANSGSFIYKIPDVGQAQKPFDSFIMRRVPAYIVVYYYTPGEKDFYMIHLSDWLKERREGARMSLTRDRAQEICTTVGTLR